MRTKKSFSIILISFVFVFINFKGYDFEAIDNYPDFYEESQVLINGYNKDAMEPFITKDGNFIFFNSLNDGVTTRLYYAEKTNETTFNFKGEIKVLNGNRPYLDAVASMDEQNKFFYITTNNYPSVFENIKSGIFCGGVVKNITSVIGDYYNYGSGWIIMDAEISRDGRYLYYVNARFNGKSFPEEAKIGIAENKDSFFKKMNSTEEIIKNINDANFLVYAPSISRDGKELYFTKVKKGTSNSEIFVSVRNKDNEVFGKPKKINIPGIMIEAPTITNDGKRIYYHKKLSIEGKYNIYTMKRR